MKNTLKLRNENYEIEKERKEKKMKSIVHKIKLK